VQVCIICGAGFASRRCLQVSSNVRRHTPSPCCASISIQMPGVAGRHANHSLVFRNSQQLASPNKCDTRHALWRSRPSAFAGTAACAPIFFKAAASSRAKLGSLHSWSGAQGRVVAFGLVPGKRCVSLLRCLGAGRCSNHFGCSVALLRGGGAWRAPASERSCEQI
jgi:hypothetical protein